MQLTIHLPPREQTMAYHRQRWDEVLQDRSLDGHAGRIETNAWGQIVMSPPAAEPHSNRQGEIAYQLRVLLGGRAKPECPMLTSDGVNAVDVGWYSMLRHRQVAGQTACEIAPEICVEILSPSNTPNEIENKFRLYFDAGAEECWVCDLKGNMTYHTKNAPDEAKSTSSLCCNFPSRIEDFV